MCVCVCVRVCACVCGHRFDIVTSIPFSFIDLYIYEACVCVRVRVCARARVCIFVSFIHLYIYDIRGKRWWRPPPPGSGARSPGSFRGAESEGRSGPLPPSRRAISAVQKPGARRPMHSQAVQELRRARGACGGCQPARVGGGWCECGGVFSTGSEVTRIVTRIVTAIASRQCR